MYYRIIVFNAIFKTTLQVASGNTMPNVQTKHLHRSKHTNRRLIMFDYGNSFSSNESLTEQI